MWYYRYMLAFERKEIIKAEILQSGSILVSEMSKKLDCSEETIRRDLKDLETDGKIKRIHGGAYLSSLDDRGLPIRIRQTLLLKEKQDIADYAFSHFISENDTIMLDSSTTCVTFAKKLFDADMPVTIITNSLLIFSAYNEYPSLETKLIGIGGNYRKRACSFVGYEATDSVSHYLADKCFISSSAVDAQHGLVDNSSNECQVRKMFIKQSRLHYLLADHTKFSDSADYIIADLASLNAVVADVPLPNEWEQILQSHNIDVHYCRTTQ
ncbi:DeoR/GlpR transcriptional regulator [Treponema socranskii]